MRKAISTAMEHCHEIPTSSLSPFTQILSLGFVWVFLHCSPMCGPIISGLRLGAGPKSVGAIRGLLLYQAGRALMYSAFGATAGLFGSKLLIRPEFSWLLVCLLGFLLFLEIFPGVLERWGKTPAWLLSATSAANQLHSGQRAFIMGILFAFLPCMLALWALSLAASTQSALKGAALMLLLVGMTTLPLLTVNWGIHRIFRGHQKLVTRLLLSVSLIWTFLVALAANSLIAHQHFIFHLGEAEYQLMFW